MMSEHCLLVPPAAKVLLAARSWGHSAPPRLWEDLWPQRAGAGQLSSSPALKSTHFPSPTWRNFSLWNSRQKTFPSISLRGSWYKKGMFYEFIGTDLTEWAGKKEKEEFYQLISVSQNSVCVCVCVHTHIYGKFSMPNKWHFSTSYKIQCPRNTMTVSHTSSPFKDLKRLFKNTCQKDTHTPWELPTELALW